jgi:hypothetical protein
VWQRAFLVWVFLVGLAILNGVAREAVLAPRLGAAAAHLVSSVLLAGLIALTAWLTIRWMAPGTARRPPDRKARAHPSALTSNPR